jgi:hypothetical protein
MPNSGQALDRGLRVYDSISESGQDAIYRRVRNNCLRPARHNLGLLQEQGLGVRVSETYLTQQGAALGAGHGWPAAPRPAARPPAEVAFRLQVVVQAEAKNRGGEPDGPGGRRVEAAGRAETADRPALRHDLGQGEGRPVRAGGAVQTGGLGVSRNETGWSSLLIVYCA